MSCKQKGCVSPFPSVSLYNNKSQSQVPSIPPCLESTQRPTRPVPPPYFNSIYPDFEDQVRVPYSNEERERDVDGYAKPVHAGVGVDYV